MNDIVVDDRMQSNKTLTLILYALYALGLFTGALTTVVAVIVNYVKYDDVRGTWLESHFRWQLRTFWFTLLYAVLIGAFVIGTFGLGLLVSWLFASVLCIWHIYRLVKGFLYLNDGKVMYPAPAA